MSPNVKSLSRVDISDFNTVSHHLLRLVEQSASGTIKFYAPLRPPSDNLTVFVCR